MATTKELTPKSVAEEVQPVISDGDQKDESNDGRTPPPLAAKLFAVVLISCISFGSHWSSGVTGAMKSTIKKVQYHRDCFAERSKKCVN
jgi:hypothetical protein